jgi:hypothetical protein
MQKLILNKALGDSMIAPIRGIELKRGDSIIASGLAGAETIDLYVKVGDSFIAATDETGTAIELTATKTALTINGSGTYQIQTGTSAGALVISFNTP